MAGDEQDSGGWGIDLGLDWDDIAEAYVGSLAAILTVFALVALLHGGRGRRRAPWA